MSVWPGASVVEDEDARDCPIFAAMMFACSNATFNSACCASVVIMPATTFPVIGLNCVVGLIATAGDSVVGRTGTDGEVPPANATGALRPGIGGLCNVDIMDSGPRATLGWFIAA